MKNKQKKDLKNNQQKRGFAYFEPFIITVFWLLLFVSPLFSYNDNYGFEWDFILQTWKSFIPYLGLSLINRYLLLPFLFFKNKRIVFALINLIIILFLAYIGNIIKDSNPTTMNFRQERMHPDMRPHGPQGEDFQMPPPDQQGRRQQMPQGRRDLPRPMQLPPYISFVLISVLVIGFDIALKLTVKWVYLEQQRMKIEKESMENQLAFLRNQVSPHFFMNTLNNIHSLIDIDTEEAKDAVIRLSKLMRHLLYESESALIPIRKEVEFIKSYIDLMRLRFSDSVKININIPDTLPDRMLPPLLFTSYLENAFKHGISYQSTSFINVDLVVNENRLKFKIENSNHKVEADEKQSGIGMENSKRRLDLLYNDTYELEIQDLNNIFSVELNLPI